MNEISESEKKRLRSLKERKQAFKAKEQVIQQALNNLDNIKNNKKIIFNDFDEEEQVKLKKKAKKDLFDNDGNNNENDLLWNEDEFKVKKSKKTTLGNDVRFTLDDRFVENDCKIEEKTVEDECILQKEKEKQMDILESVLGMPLFVKSQETQSTKKGLMIRYDPTENKHREYEIKAEQLKTKEKNTKKKKHDKLLIETEEPSSVAPEPEVSKDIYYTVSNTLTESLKQKKEFSLLKIFGREKDETEHSKDNNTFNVENNEVERCKFNFNANSAFKYDSSDDENTHEALDINKEMDDKIKEDTQQNSLFGRKDTLFFDNSDVRFNEAVKFFSTGAVSNDKLINLRRELKSIIRMKIRNNERKRQPYGKKKKIKKFH